MKKTIKSLTKFLSLTVLVASIFCFSSVHGVETTTTQEVDTKPTPNVDAKTSQEVDTKPTPKVEANTIQEVDAKTTLVANGGLESGDSSGFTGYGDWDVVNNNASKGTYCARIGSGSAFEQVITGLNPSTIYTLKANVKVEKSSGSVTVGINEFGGQETNYSVSPLAYTEVLVNFRTGVSSTSARIYLYMHSSSSGYAYGDDFEVYPFEIPDTEYNVYFGGFHDHTGYSDGQGTPDQAFQYAKDYGDFITTTEHNTFGINRQLSNSDWSNSRAAANRNSINNRFIGMTGFEMTTNSWGHSNVFNTDYYFPWAKTLSGFYSSLLDDPNAIGQFNHPGWAGMNHFEDFGHLTPELDNIMELLEVGNGYGPMDRSGNYGWYFGSYITALDKGWHIAPTNNQDNHKPTWLQEMPTRTAVLAHTLDRANIIDAIKNKRVYATEDKNLKIIYRINDQIMGSILTSPQQLDFNIDIENPETDVAVKEIRLVADGGRVIQTKTCTSNIENWSFTIPPQYSYYLLYVTLEDGSTAVTAPIWTGLPVAPKMTPKITLATTPKTSHEKFVVNVSGLRPAHLTDWIGIYEENQTPDGSPRSIWYSNIQNLHIDDNGTGSFIFDPNEIPDGERGRYQSNRTYKLIYAYDDKYDVVTSTSFSINSSGVSLTNNLALNKTVTASSYWDNQPNCIEENAVDGNANTCWNAGRDTSSGQWIEVDFGANTTFNKIVTKSSLDRIAGYKLQYWNGTEYKDIMNCSGISPIREDVFNPVTARKVRLYVLSTKTDQNGWGISPRIDEFEVYNDPNARKTMQNLALYKTATASSNWDSDTTRPIKAFDGSAESTWNAARGTSADEWLELDFGQPTTFNTISLTAYLNRISEYKLQYWDGSNWIDIFKGGSISANKFIKFADTTSQKIRIYIISTQNDQNDWGSDPAINEIEVYRQ